MQIINFSTTQKSVGILTNAEIVKNCKSIYRIILIYLLISFTGDRVKWTKLKL